jgi:hypothetical protein
MSQEPNHIDAAIADLEGWLERISTAIGTLKYFRSQGGALPALPAPIGTGRVSLNGDIPHDAFFQMTVADAAEKYLTLAKNTKPTSGLADSLLKGGLKTAAKKFPSMLNTVLSGDSRFVKVNKEWSLSAWYPGMRRGPRAATTETAVDSKPSGGPVKNEPKGEHKKGRFSPDSLKGLIVSLLNSKPGEMFDPKKTAAALQKGNQTPSVTTALCTLVAEGVIARPQKGQYQSLHKQPIA